MTTGAAVQRGRFTEKNSVDREDEESFRGPVGTIIAVTFNRTPIV